MKLGMVAMVVCGAIGTAAADRHEVTGASFDAPAGVQASDAPDHATVVYHTGDRFAIFVVYAPHAAPGGAAATFAADWKNVTVNTPTKDVPAPAWRKVGARNVLGATTDATSDGNAVVVQVQLLDVVGQVVPILVYTQDRKMLQSYQGDFDAVINTIQLAAPPAPPAPTEPAPPAGGARKLTTITLKDVAGSWNSHDQAITTYVNSQTGGYSGTQATSVQDWYDIAADGSYAHRFQGLANGHVVRESSKGVLSMTADGIVLTEGGKVVRRYHFLELAIDADGAAHWKLLDAQYPINQANIGLYAETWGRAAPKK